MNSVSHATGFASAHIDCPCGPPKEGISSAPRFEHNNWHKTNMVPKPTDSDVLVKGKAFLDFHRAYISRFDSWRDA